MDRIDLQNLFEDILGVRQVYFQPPESLKIKYPAIVYSRNPIDSVYADDKIYQKKNSYNATLIDTDPESVYVEQILNIPSCSHVQHYTADNLHHDVFRIYI